MQPADMHPELSRILANQGGAFTPAQALAHHTWRTVERWKRAGAIVRDGYGVYRLADRPADLPYLIHRAGLRLGIEPVACLHTAAALHGFGVLADPRLHLTTPDGRSILNGPGVVFHQIRPRAPLTAAAGVLATDVADTAVDIACATSRINVLPVLDAALRASVSRADLRLAVERACGRRGICEVREWSELADRRAESPMESRARFRLIAAGLPRPGLQIPVATPAGWRYVDMGWEHYRVGVEYEGEEFHTGDGVLRRDRRRHNEVSDRDWRLIYATSDDIYRTHHRFTALVRRALERAGFRA